ncbi:MAG: cytochrome c family protein [Deltaproteobacteria bacterium]|nr:cytochrome c family protein [Deltaproteobacteria bacterium]
MRQRNLPVQTTYWLMMIWLLAAMVLVAKPGQGAAAGTAENVCIQCHGKLPGKYGEPVRLWQGSIHAENGIACNSCHGGDPRDAANAMSPARGFLGAPREKDIPAFCGRCHVGVLKDYLTSQHGKALGKGGPTCVTCHGNHRVSKASLELINEKNCSRCHGFKQAETIKVAMGATENRILAIDARIAGVKQKGVDTDRLEKGLFAVRNRFHSLFHTVDTARVATESVLLQSELQKLDDLLMGIDEVQRNRKLIGAFAVAGALLAALLAYLLRKTFDQPET